MTRPMAPWPHPRETTETRAVNAYILRRRRDRAWWAVLMSWWRHVAPKW